MLLILTPVCDGNMRFRLLWLLVGVLVLFNLLVYSCAGSPVCFLTPHLLLITIVIANYSQDCILIDDFDLFFGNIE